MTGPSDGHSPRCVVADPRRSIVVVGDDPLMLRTLDRLLRTAGYRVGIGEQSAEPPGAGAVQRARSDVDLTIVDVPDDWSRASTSEATPVSARYSAAREILWIGATQSAGKEPERCLVKPFTSSQFLEKVRFLLNQQPLL